MLHLLTQFPSPLSDQDFTFTVRSTTTNFNTDRQFVISVQNPSFTNKNATITQSNLIIKFTHLTAQCFVVSNVNNELSTFK